ncbi:MAG TPA: hypothetical protein VF278_21465 [Pirellulales bacterium]
MTRLGYLRAYLRLRLLFCAVVAVAVFSSFDESNLSGEEGSARRTLHFPSDRAVGTLFLRLPEAKPSAYSMYGNGWIVMRKTRGDVRVPAQALVRLDVGKAASGDLAWLDAFEPDDIQGVSLDTTDVNDGTLRHLTRLTGLRSINLRGTRISDAGLTGFDALTNLEEIWLDALGIAREGFGVGDGAMRVLGRLHKLRTANLRFTKITDGGLAELARCGSLTDLDLEGTNVSDASMPHLVALPGLERLSLGGYSSRVNLTNEGLKPIGKLVNLTRLNLSGTRITGEGLAHLYGLTKLKALDLEATQISESDLFFLEPLKSLEWLSLYAENGSTDVAAERLARLKSLRHLHAHFRVSEEGVAWLASLPRLENLAFNGPGVTDDCAESIAKMASLKKVWFEDCPITDATLAAVAGLPNLERLMLSRTRVTGDGIGELRRARKLTNLDVNFDPPDEQQPVNLPRPHLRGIGKLAQLKQLVIWGRSLAGRDLEDIAGLTSLEYLQLAMPVDDAGASALTRLTRLSGLRIEGGVLTDPGIKQLSYLSRLRFLEVEGSFTDAGLLELAPLGELNYLGVRSSNVTDAGLRALSRELPVLQRAMRR